MDKTAYSLKWRICRRLWHAFGSALPSGIREWVLLRAFQLRDGIGFQARRTAYKDAVGEPGITVVGMFSEPTGLGQSAQGIWDAMQTSVIRTKKIDCGGVSGLLSKDVPTSDCDPYKVNLWCLNGFEMFFAMRKMSFSRVTTKKNVCYWYWELEKLPLFWRPAFDYVDEVWAASRFNAECFRKAAPSGVVVRQIPPTVSVSPLHRDWRTYFSFPHDRLLVLVLFDFGSVAERKNPGAAVQTLLEYKRRYGGANFFLVVKTRNMGLFPREKQALLAQLSGIEYVIIDASLEREEVIGLYQACDVVINLHRSEGFGLVLAEAMALGKAVIATAWSAPAEFMTEENSWPIPYRLVRNPRRCGPYPKGALWADADIDAAAQALKIIVDNPGLRRDKGEKARDTIQRLYSPEKTQAAIEGRFSEWNSTMR